ncbi:MAG: extracellular solute-binding protein [Caldilinea sp.]|nr:extracellular solute-binding protein [Caldilinea sp.]MDW8439903.1 extracellular solute-binding protein [Caldilineaceae bacterium]
MRSLWKLGRVAALALVLTAFGAGHRTLAEAPAIFDRNAAFTVANTSPLLIEVTADAFGLPRAEDEIARQYDKPSVLLQEGDRIEFLATIPADGVYTIAFDVAADTASVRAPEGALHIDGELPVDDLRRVVFPVFYRNTADDFPKDRYGNDALIRQERMVHWTKAPARDVNFSQPYPLRIELRAGEHRFNFTLQQGTVHLGSIYIEEFTPYLPYKEYRAMQRDRAISDFMLTLEAEFPSYKNDTSVRPSASRSLTVTPYDTYRLLLNTLGGESWIKSGSAVYYEFEVPQDGLYSITLRALQDTRSNFTVFRRFTINGETPFVELNAFPFSYTTDWVDVPLGDGAPFQIFLHKGRNVLGVEATNSPYLPAIQTVQKALLDINELALEIRKLTGNQRNPFKEWVVSDYIPDIRERLTAIAENLRADKETLVAILRSDSSPEILTYQMAIDNLLFLAEEPDRIPTHMGRFSEGPGSAAQLLGSLLPMLQEQPLALDKIYIHSPDVKPVTPSAPFGLAFTEGLKRFFHSFQPDPYESIGAGEDELEVWVNRPRQYVDLLQLMADESFTPRTGIRVKFSIMPDESKLVLANAAGIQPDVALGISTHIPYDLAVRNALYNLRSFDDFDSFIRIYSPGSLLSYIIDDSVYAIPETQDFWITFYRKDILDAFGLPVPRTWDEVVEILPELQRYGMNYSSPLSGDAGIRWYFVTAPYLFNFGAKLYSDDGFASGLGSEEALAAVRFMTESFTIYGMPLTTASFYESFRYGLLPIGVSNIETYVKLMTAAPELEGLWGVDLYPATVLPDGTQNRYATGSAQASIMFKNTDKAQEGWEFLKWWMSTETQVDFQERLLLNYGKEYLWNSANLEAFAALPIPQEHRRVILEQWQWLQEPVRLPGSYMQERELGNAWNRIVFDGINPRVAIDRAILVTNREITRKMEEFGYLRNGVRVRTPKIPTIETVKGWMNDAS